MKLKLALLTLFLFFSIHSSSQFTPFSVTPNLNSSVTITPNTSFISIYNWDLEYGLAGFTPGSGILITNISTFTYTLNLNLFSDWEFRIKNRVGPNPVWTDKLSIIGNCSNNPKYVGYSYNFNNYTFDSCWRGYRTNGGDIYQSDVLINTNFLGTTVKMTTNQNRGVMLISPRLEDLSTDKKITFKFFGDIGVPLVVGTMTNPLDPSTFHPLNSYSPTSTSNLTTLTLYFNNLHATDKYVAFRYHTTANVGGSSCYIDDFEYFQSINCFDASDFQLTNVTENSASFTFNSQNQTNWEVNYGIGTNVNAYQSIFVSGPFTLTNLWGLRNYNCRIRAVCGADHFSNWSPIIAFTTPCTPMQDGYFNGFEDFGFNNCWNRLYTNTSGAITHSIAPNNNQIFGNYVCRIEGSNMANRDALLVSTFIDSFQDKRIRFKILDPKQTATLHNLPFIVGTLSNPNDPNSFIPLVTYSPDYLNPLKFNENKSIWQQQIIDFNGLTIPSDHHYIGFKIGKNSSLNALTTSTILMDEFYFESSPPCKEPVNLQIEKYEDNFVNLSWNNSQNSNATQWQIEYGPEGFALGSGTQISASTNNFTIQNLTPSTSYDFYVRSVCGTSNSEWSSKVNCKTRCEAKTAGYTTSFEGDNLSTGNSCWRRLYPKSRSHIPDSFITVMQPMNNPSAQNGTAGVMIWGHPNSTAPTHLERIFVSPRIADLNNQKIISFWMLIQAGSMESITIGTLSDPDDSTTFTPFRQLLPPFNASQWVKVIVDFSSYTLSDQFIGIRQKSGANSSARLYFDNFSYYENPCLQPNVLGSEQISATAVKLNWQSNDPTITEWQIEYGVSGFTPGNGIVVNVNSNPFVLNGLQENLTYVYRVRNICANNSVNWSSWYTFKTACLVTAPFTENFDQYTVLDEFYIENPQSFCWTPKRETIVTSGLNLLYLNNINSNPNAAFITSANNSNDFFVSPLITNFNSNKRLRFWAYRQIYQSDNSTIVVGTMKNPMDTSTFTPITSFQISPTDFSGREFNVDFSNYTGDNKHIAFQVNHDPTIPNPLRNKVYIDNVIVDDIPQCREPLNFQSNYTSSTSTVLSWSNLNGTSSFLIEYGPNGFTLGNGIQTTTNNNSITISNLIPNTTYVFYIKSICGNGSSSFSNPLKIKTPCAPLNLPWSENFNNLPIYGMNNIPTCFTRLFNNIISYNSNLYVLNGYDSFSQPNGLITGENDSTFLFWEPNSSLISPVFNLLSGTTYKLKYMGRCEYEYALNYMKVEVLKGNESYFKICNLFNTGSISEFNYLESSYYFTPMENAEFSFSFLNSTSGLKTMVTDSFKLEEGYNAVITQPRTIDFNQNLDTNFIQEKTTYTNIERTTIQGNNVLKYSGGNQITTNPTWLNSQENVSKLNFKINPTGFTTLALRFDLKQTYVNNPNDSAFRVVVNGEAISNDIYPSSPTNDDYITYQFDLSNYINQNDLRVSLQHRGYSTTNQGDSAYLDNLEISNVLLLNNQDFDLNTIAISPNPSSEIVNFTSNIPIETITLTNISGVVLNEFNVNNLSFSMPVNNFAAGIYFAIIKQNGLYKTFKLIKN